MGSSGHRLDQLRGVLPYRLPPRKPVAEQFPRAPDVLPFVDTLNRRPHFLGHVLHTQFLGHRFPFGGLLLLPVDPVLEPNSTGSLQPGPLRAFRI